VWIFNWQTHTQTTVECVMLKITPVQGFVSVWRVNEWECDGLLSVNLSFQHCWALQVREFGIRDLTFLWEVHSLFVKSLTWKLTVLKCFELLSSMLIKYVVDFILVVWTDLFRSRLQINQSKKFAVDHQKLSVFLIIL